MTQEKESGTCTSPWSDDRLLYDVANLGPAEETITVPRNAKLHVTLIVCPPDPFEKWMEDKTVRQAWGRCRRADWILRLADKVLKLPRELLAELSLVCAEVAAEAAPRGSDAPRMVQVARMLLDGRSEEMTIEDADVLMGADHGWYDYRVDGAETAAAGALKLAHGKLYYPPEWIGDRSARAVGEAAGRMGTQEYVRAENKAHREMCRIMRRRAKEWERNRKKKSRRVRATGCADQEPSEER